jgi:hypothetical protein
MENFRDHTLKFPAPRDIELWFHHVYIEGRRNKYQTGITCIREDMMSLLGIQGGKAANLLRILRRFALEKPLISETQCCYLILFCLCLNKKRTTAVKVTQDFSLETFSISPN